MQRRDGTFTSISYDDITKQLHRSNESKTQRLRINKHKFLIELLSLKKQQDIFHNHNKRECEKEDCILGHDFGLQRGGDF